MLKNIWMLVNTAFAGLFVAIIIDCNTHLDGLGIIACAICFGVEAFLMISDVVKHVKIGNKQKMVKAHVLR